MVKVLSIILAVLLTASTVQAQQLPTAGERRAADVASYVTLGTVMALDVRAAWKSQDRAHALQMLGARALVTYAWASIAKGLTQRVRPDGSDAQSFYSMHTAMAFQTLGGPRLAFVLPLSGSTGGLRVAAGKHWVTDVLVGAGVGALTSRIR